MKIQSLEFVRIELFRALTDSSGITKGQLEAFSEHYCLKRNSDSKKHIRQAEPKGGQKVKAETMPLNVKETRNRPLVIPLISEYEFSSCNWRRAVLELEVLHQAWVRYCYGSDMQFGYQITLCQHIWRRHYAKLAGRQLKVKVKKRLMTLVWLVVQDVAAKNINDKYREYSGSALANLMSITRQTWSEIYAPHWLQLKKIVEMLDKEALVRVLSVCEKYNKKKTILCIVKPDRKAYI